MARKPVAFPHQWNSNLPLSLPPLFLTPTLALASSAPSTSIQVQPLSSTAAHAQRPSRRDRNRLRGVSAIRRTGPRWPLSMSQYELPRPVKDPPQRKEFKTNPDHGLWGFFNKGRTAMNKPEDDVAHGRAWTYQELSIKSFEDLHRLYWVCHKDRNQVLTSSMEQQRVRAGYGKYEADERLKTTKETMDLIFDVLRDRHENIEESRALMKIRNLKDIVFDDGEDLYNEYENEQEEQAEDDPSTPEQMKRPVATPA